MIAATTVGHWIEGHAPARTTRAPVHDPATGVLVREVLLGDAATVDAAVATATEAARAWGEVAVTRRVRAIRLWGQLLADHGDEFVRIMGEEQGKVRADAAGELMRALETLDVACSAGLLLKGEISDNIAGGIDMFSVRAPLGVCAAITPFNFPLMAPLYLSSIAIACGNAMLVKPSERVPSASVLMARLAEEAGLPAGVLSVVQGDRTVVEAILDHPGIAAVSFIGSSPVARLVHARGSAAGKRVQAFGGAKNHMVVMPDADIGFAADAAVSAAFGSSGQRCMAVSVVAAVGGCGDALVAAIADRAARGRGRARLERGGRDGAVDLGRRQGARRDGDRRRAGRGGDRRPRRPRARRASGDGYYVGPTPASTESLPTWTSTATRCSGQCSACCASTAR